MSAKTPAFIVAESRSGAPPNAPEAQAALLQAANGGTLTVPFGALLLTADYARVGADLVLTGEGGAPIVVVQDFFAVALPPNLVSEGGAMVDAALAMRLAGTRAPGQYAAAGDGVEAQPIGRVAELEGEATATRVDGTKVVLAKDSPVFRGDVIETAEGAALEVVFVDESTFSVGEQGRMVLDELVFDPSTLEGNSTISVLQGVFVFVSGEIAAHNPEAMAVKTPVATIGIRGTAVAIYAAQEGEQNKIALLSEQTPDGQTTVGAVVISNEAGTVVLDEAFETTVVDSVFTAPGGSYIAPPAEIGGLMRQLGAIAPPSVEHLAPASNPDTSETGQQTAAAEDGATPGQEAGPSPTDAPPDGAPPPDAQAPPPEGAAPPPEGEAPPPPDSQAAIDDNLTGAAPEGVLEEGPAGPSGPTGEPSVPADTGMGSFIDTTYGGIADTSFSGSPLGGPLADPFAGNGLTGSLGGSAPTESGTGFDSGFGSFGPAFSDTPPSTFDAPPPPPPPDGGLGGTGDQPPPPPPNGGGGLVFTTIPTSGDDTLGGSPGNDTFSAISGNDIVFGNSGDDILDGGPGNDILFGGIGQDYMTGGPGSDVFAYLNQADVGFALNGQVGITNGDFIADFAVGVDQLRFVGGPASTFSGAGTVEIGTTFFYVGNFDGTDPGGAPAGFFVYDTSNFTLYHDDGSAAATGYTVIATFSNGASLTPTDLQVAPSIV